MSDAGRAGLGGHVFACIHSNMGGEQQTILILPELLNGGWGVAPSKKSFVNKEL